MINSVSVDHARASQSELQLQLEALQKQMNAVQQQTQCPLQLDQYIKKLQNAKRRVVIVNNILQTTQVRDALIALPCDSNTTKHNVYLGVNTLTLVHELYILYHMRIKLFERFYFHFTMFLS